ncbi:MAG: hypothetical protein ACT4OU_01170 [Hyphomicrobium sp.]
MKRTTLSIIAVSSMALLATSAAADNRAATYAIALATSAAFIAAAFAANAPHLRRGAPATTEKAQSALIETTHVTTMTFAWAGLAMLSIYLLTPLHWRHGWQYGSIFALIAAGNAIFARTLEAGATAVGAGAATAGLRRILQLSALLGLAAAVALIWMISAGKLATDKGDWAANAIFLGGGIAIAAICAIVVKAHWPLTK